MTDQEAMRLARDVYAEVEDDLDRMIDHPEDWPVGDVVSLACKLADAIMHPGE
jgi:hypothetical protein